MDRLEKSKVGVLLVVEGIECAGKDSCLDAVKAPLDTDSSNFIFTRELGGTFISEQIRSLLLKHANVMSAETETCLAHASRLQHVQDLISPALDLGKVVVTNRYSDSTYAYQGAKGASEETLNMCCPQHNGKPLAPTGTIFLDLPTEVMVRRKTIRNADGTVEDDAIEQRALVFFDKVRKRYLERALATPSTIVLNADDTPENVLNVFKQAFDHIAGGADPKYFAHPSRKYAQELERIIDNLGVKIEDNS